MKHLPVFWCCLGIRHFGSMPEIMQLTSGLCLKAKGHKTSTIVAKYVPDEIAINNELQHTINKLC